MTDADSADSASTAAPAVPSDEDCAAADDLKAQANTQFKEGNFYEAIELYTKAIELNPTSAVFHSNRAAAHIKIDQHGSAMADAAQAIKLDPKYVKLALETAPRRSRCKRVRKQQRVMQAYYRRGDAKLALGRFGAALRDFKLAAAAAPRDPDLKRKLAECAKESQRLRFEKALRSDVEEVPVSKTIVLEDIVVDDSYEGPRMAKAEAMPPAEADDGAAAAAGAAGTEASTSYAVTREFVVAMMDAFKAQKALHRRFVLEVLLQFQALVKALPSLVDLAVPEDGKITVCGDTHGQYYDLLRIFELNGLPSAENPYLFNGDFVDRGSFSLEVIVTLMAWKVLDPACMHLTRGNHEAQSLNKLYGFEGEVKHKLNMTAMDVFRETFCWLPLAYCLSGTVLVLHGGLFSRDDVTLDDIRREERCREPPDSGIMCECLWSDPQPEAGRAASKRGCGIQFGPDVTKDFLQRNGLSLLVRSHEVKDEGYEVAHDGYCVTVFSAPNYCDNMANKGAFITFNGADMVPHFTQFEAVPHPDVKPMAYANSIFNFL